ncbi:COMM domain-containing protein 5-like [Rhopilema esculentum]|uniref:COMM domain-containing protein 5-like n=1 Tax=Rhopilema esculentum TaxID=499914 RepID=UPI0031DE473F|eukprot:gene14771-5878_t
MARERGTSLLQTFEESASFFGPKVPETVRKTVRYFSKLEKSTMRKLIQVALKDIEGEEIPGNTLQSIKPTDVDEEVLLSAYAGILQILTLAFRFPPGSLKKDVFVKELSDLKVPPELIEDLTNVVFSAKQHEIDKKLIENRIQLPKLDSLRWRVDVGISTSVLNRVLEPTILMEMNLDNGKSETFEVPVSKFHELRYNVATVLKEMEDLEKHSILKIQT